MENNKSRMVCSLGEMKGGRNHFVLATHVNVDGTPILYRLGGGKRKNGKVEFHYFKWGKGKLIPTRQADMSTEDKSGRYDSSYISELAFDYSGDPYCTYDGTAFCGGIVHGNIAAFYGKKLRLRKRFHSLIPQLDGSYLASYSTIEKVYPAGTEFEQPTTGDVDVYPTNPNVKPKIIGREHNLLYAAPNATQFKEVAGGAKSLDGDSCYLAFVRYPETASELVVTGSGLHLFNRSSKSTIEFKGQTAFVKGKDVYVVAKNGGLLIARVDGTKLVVVAKHKAPVKGLRVHNAFFTKHGVIYLAAEKWGHLDDVQPSWFIDAKRVDYKISKIGTHQDLEEPTDRVYCSAPFFFKGSWSIYELRGSELFIVTLSV